ncbi:hypothetical protein B0J17DRAFT_633948 [Rhizoctonia solani]|nr:hypothetical protein B0J17DRAFT_633948 [Rhizoctonia solani]
MDAQPPAGNPPADHPKVLAGFSIGAVEAAKPLLSVPGAYYWTIVDSMVTVILYPFGRPSPPSNVIDRARALRPFMPDPEVRQSTFLARSQSSFSVTLSVHAVHAYASLSRSPTANRRSANLFPQRYLSQWIQASLQPIRVARAVHLVQCTIPAIGADQLQVIKPSRPQLQVYSQEEWTNEAGVPVPNAFVNDVWFSLGKGASKKLYHEIANPCAGS